MNQPHLLELAKQGDVDAIATLLCHSLKSQGIQATARFQSHCLEVVLEAPQLPPPAIMAASIRRGLVALKVTAIHRVRILGRPAQPAASPWTEEIQLRAGRGSENGATQSISESRGPVSRDLSAGLVGSPKSLKSSKSPESLKSQKSGRKAPTPIHWPPSSRSAAGPLRANPRSQVNRPSTTRRTDGRTVRSWQRRKKTWLAVNLSMIWPGLGQLYANAVLKGAFLLGGQIAAIAIALWSVFGADGDTMLGLGLIPVAIGIWIVGMFDAHHSARRFAPPDAEVIPRHHKDPWFAVFLSQVLPGLGHLYSEKVLVGAFFLSCTVIFVGIRVLFPALLLFPPLVAAVACYHAYVTFPSLRHRSADFMLAIATAILLFRLTFSYTPTLINQQVERFIIPSESMLPTLKVEDRIFVSKSTRYYPQSGDIIVFQPTEMAQQSEQDPDPFQDSAQFSETRPEKFYVKRIIGQPGQTVQISQGKVYLNGQLQDENYLAEPPNYEWGPETIPANSYFVLGDNRNHSADSHLWGFLPQENIVGKAYKIYWPPHRVMPLL